MSGARPRFRMAPRAAQLDSSAEIVGETPEASPVYTRKVLHRTLTLKRHQCQYCLTTRLKILEVLYWYVIMIFVIMKFILHVAVS
jgi:hypothetical protein